MYAYFMKFPQLEEAAVLFPNYSVFNSLLDY